MASAQVVYESPYNNFSAGALVTAILTISAANLIPLVMANGTQVVMIEVKK